MKKRSFIMDSWPGFVDILASIIMVLLFILLVFIYGQFSLNSTLEGRNAALNSVTQQLNELAKNLQIKEEQNNTLSEEISVLSDQFAQEQQRSASLQQDLKTLTLKFETTNSEVVELRASYNALQNQYQQEQTNSQQLQAKLATLSDQSDQDKQALQEKLTTLKQQYNDSKDSLEQQRALTKAEQDKLLAAQQSLAATERNTAILNKRLEELSALLQEHERRDEEQQVHISNLGEKLNQALASQVQQLNKYRSEFFGTLRQVLGDNADIRIEGDRFVLQSEILFAKGQAVLNDASTKEMQKIASIISSLTSDIPPTIDWVLRVDGHTDTQPIKTALFPSNWELSMARAIAVTKQLINFGVPAKRLVPAGFASFHPIDDRKDEIAYRRNRRIEFKLTNR